MYNIFTWQSRRKYLNRTIVGTRCVFDHDNGVGARWERGTCHDADGITRVEISAHSLRIDAGSDLANESKLNRDLDEVSRSDGISVTSRSGERRKITVGNDGCGENTIASLGEAHAFRTSGDARRGEDFYGSTGVSEGKD